jgi:hypothetical protein
VVAVQTFPGDGGELMSRPRGEKKQWVRSDAAIAAIKDGIAKSPVKKRFFHRRRQMDHRRRLPSGSETTHEALNPWMSHLFAPGEQFNADVSKTDFEHWGKSWPPAVQAPYSPYFNPVDVLIGSVLKEKAQAMSHANLAALSAAITE